MLSRIIGVLVVLGLCSGCLRAAREWQGSTPNALLIGPYVILTGPTTAIVSFRQSAGTSARIVWKTSAGKGTSVRAERNGDHYIAELEDLPHGPVISYDVVVGERTLGRGSFRAGLGPGETKLRFAVFGDTRTNHMVHDAVIQALAKEKIDFFLHTGDMVERGGREDLWITFFEIERPLMQQAAIFPAIGNHDLGNRGYYPKYFLLNRWNKGRSYYVADFGNVRLVAVDVTIICERRCSQYAYVEKALADGAADNKIMVLFMHHPPYSSGAHGSDLRLRAVVADLAKRYGVELVVTGHDHDYERTKPIDGTTYIVSGSAGAPVRPIRPREFTAEARTEPHYVLVDVDGEQLGIRAINLRGEVFDSTAIPLNPPGGPPPVPAPTP
jgi:predicted phosphodiesterase